MEPTDQLLDPTRLRGLWDRPEGDDPGKAALTPEAEIKLIPDEPERIALDRLEAAVRRDLGANVAPIEPFLARARVLIITQLDSKRAEKEAAELAEFVAKAEAAAAAAGIDLNDPPPPEAPADAPAEETPAEAPPAEAGPRKQVKKSGAGPTKEASKQRGPGTKGGMLDKAGSYSGQAGLVSQYHKAEDSVEDGEQWEADRAKEEEANEARRAAREKNNKGGRTNITDYGLGQTFGIAALSNAVAIAKAGQRMQEDVEYMRQDEERRQARLALLGTPLTAAALDVNKATLGQVLDVIEELYRALKLTPS